MSDWSNTTGQGTSGGTDISSKLQGIILQLSSLVQLLMGQNAAGTFTMPAANTLVVPNAAVAANTTVSLDATNASAATLMGSAKALYYTVQPGVSFTVFTANGVAAAGTEQFSYRLAS